MWLDIGGRGFGPDGNEVFEEGLLIPITKFAERGQVQPLLIEMIRANVRTPDQTVGDMYSLAACNEAGDRRLQAMMDEFGIDDLQSLSDFVIETSRKATLEAIAKVPSGTFHETMQVDGYDAPVHMEVTLSVDGDQLLADFAGTSGMGRFGVNCPEVYTRAYACYALKCAIAPEVPNNTGSLETIPHHRAGRLHSGGQTPRAGFSTSRHGPPGARCGSGRIAQGDAGHGSV